MKRPLALSAILLSSLALLVSPALVSATPALAATAPQGGYRMLTANGRVYSFGGASDLGSSPYPASRDIAGTPSGNGYWVLSNTTTLNFGDAPDLRDFITLDPGEIITSISSTPSGQGYWLFSDQGRVFPRGDAVSYGDMTGVHLNGPVLDAVATPSGHGYYMVGSDGGIFTFGDAAFHGSTGNLRLNKAVTSMAPRPDGGYWLVASDGGIFAFDAPFLGSMGGTKLNKPISGIVASPTGSGYLMVASDGGVFAFGDVPFYGSLGGNPPSSAVVSIAAIGPPPVTPPAVYTDTTPLATITGTGDVDSAPFSMTTGPATLNYSCQSSGAYGYGCSYTLYDYNTGSQVGFASPDANTSGTAIFHPTADGTYYLEVQEFNDITQWSASITQQQCVENCG